MKMTRIAKGFLLFGLVAFPLTAIAGLPSGGNLELDRTECRMNTGEKAAIRDEVAKHSRRLFLASMEAADHPEQFLVVKNRVAAAMEALSARYGPTCVAEAGGRVLSPHSTGSL